MQLLECLIIQGSKGIRQLLINLYTSIMMIHKIIPSTISGLKDWTHNLMKPTNKVVKPTNKKTLL